MNAQDVTLYHYMARVEIISAELNRTQACPILYYANITAQSALLLYAPNCKQP